MSSFGYFIREAFIGFKRNLSTSLGSVITVFLSMLIVGVFLAWKGASLFKVAVACCAVVYVLELVLL